MDPPNSENKPDWPPLGGPQDFATTRWSIVLATGGDRSSAASTKALEQLCRAYWFPLYVFLRRQGRSPEDAQDLTQSFLAHLLQHDRLQQVAPEKGRFRSFLLASLGNFICDQLDKANAQKRGGGAKPISWDALEIEERFALEPADLSDPAKAFERRWALTLVERAIERLAHENTGDARQRKFDRLRVFLIDAADGDNYAEVGRDLEMTEGAVKVAVLRLRQRFRVLFREEIAETVSDEAELEDEMRHIFAILNG